MKNIVLILSIAPLFFLYTCKKDKHDAPKDNITYSSINKTIYAGQSIYLGGGCDSLLCTIDTTCENKLKQVKFFKLYDTDCNGDSYFMISICDSVNFKRFLKGDLIYSDADWCNELFIDSLAGKGEIFIGRKNVFYPGGYNRYHYGWIRLVLSENKDELRIIDQAKNLTEGNPIKAGQTE